MISNQLDRTVAVFNKNVSIYLPKHLMNNVASKYIISHTFFPHVSQKVIFLKYISMLQCLSRCKAQS